MPDTDWTSIAARLRRGDDGLGPADSDEAIRDISFYLYVLALAEAERMVEKQQDNENIHQEVMTGEKNSSSTRAPDAGGDAGIGGD